ncbi:MAG: hypothetical protein [Microviridae sp.]|nr:MAG: hypothetical protein [Microviridae sp.]
MQRVLLVVVVLKSHAIMKTLKSFVGDTMSLASIGAALSGFGQAAGGLSGLFGGGGKKGPDYQDQIAGQIQLWEDQIPALVNGAKAAGINPLYAIGANPAQAPSFSIGGGGSSRGDVFDSLAEMGQGVGRAVSAYQGKAERVTAAMAAKLGLENQELQNEYIKSQIALNRAQLAPSFPSGSSAGNSPVEIIPTTAHPRSSDAGQRGSSSKPIYQVWDTPAGGFTTFSDDVGQYMENDPLSIPAWYANALMRDLPAYLGKQLRNWWDSKNSD